MEANKICFIVCPIGENGSEIRKNSDQLLKHILQPVCEECGFKCIRVDEINNSDNINDTIIQYLSDSDLVIADLSTHNPNAFFELGYRTALGKPVIHVKNDKDTIPFDVAGVRTIIYNLSDLDKVDETKNRLKKTIQNLRFTPDNSKSKYDKDFNSLLLTEIFKIQDEIKNLNISIKSQNNAAVSILADKLSNSPQSLEIAIIQSLFSLLESPNAVKNITALSQMGANNASDASL